MRKFKDFIKDIIYDKNDLLIAVIILAVAAFVINDRLDVVMNYPEYLAAQEQSNLPVDAQPDSDAADKAEDPSGESPDTPADDTQENPGQGEDSGKPATPVQPANPTPDQPVAPGNSDLVSIYIEYGSTGSQIAQLLVDSGLLKSKEEFYDAVNAAGADTKLQAGSFKIPANATPDKIISIITN